MAEVYSSPIGPAITAVPARPPKLLDRLRAALRTKHYALRTEEAYVAWVRRFVLFHGKRHPRDMSAGEIERGASGVRIPLDRQGTVAGRTQT